MARIKRWPGLSAYDPIWLAMQSFTEQRQANTENQIWQVEHAAVYTLGKSSQPGNILNSQNIPIVKCNRGGQVTYHGPGQAVVYPLIDLNRAKIYPKEYVFALEESILCTLSDFGLQKAQRVQGAPGVYYPLSSTEFAKIAALGVKLTRGCSYHGLSINVDMDLEPFDRINPCGYENLRSIDMQSLGADASLEQVFETVTYYLQQRFPD